MHLLGLRANVRGGLLEERHDVRREQGRDRTILWISLLCRHGGSLSRAGRGGEAKRRIRGGKLRMPHVIGQPSSTTK